MSKASEALDWDSLRIFLAIVRSGSLRRAAETLAVNHATIARGLGGLEQALATRLFSRSRSGLTLTQAGEDLVSSAERIEHEILTAQRRVSGRDTQPSGVVRVSVPPILADRFLGPDLARFAIAFPEIDLRVVSTNRFADLSRLETDVSIRIVREVDEDVLGRRVIQYAKCVYASPGYLQARPEMTVGDGKEAAWIGWGSKEKRPAWVRAGPFPNAPVRHALLEAVLHIEAAAAGMGMTYLPCFIGDADPRLARVPGVAPEDDRSIWLLLHSDLKRTGRVRAFVDFMAEAILEKRALIRGKSQRRAGADASLV
ncbi:MAG: LysR family transcriptional regulator [Pseudomonadota bacterium]